MTKSLKSAMAAKAQRYSEVPMTDTKLSPADLVAAYEQMLLIRRFEERAGQLYGMGVIGGFCHLYIGQEAVVVGLQKCMNPQDTVITSYRDHGHMLVCGMDPKGVMAELAGRATGYSKGKGGSMHMFSREKNFFGDMELLRRKFPLAQVWLLPISIKAITAFVLFI